MKYQDGTLIPEEAQRIILVSTTYDMPLLLNYTLAFALFKSYAPVRMTFTLHVRVLMLYGGVTSHPYQSYCPCLVNSSRQRRFLNVMRMCVFFYLPFRVSSC